MDISYTVNLLVVVCIIIGIILFAAFIAVLLSCRCKTARRSKKTAAILSLLLGGLGADRIYLGYTFLGILKFLTLGGFGLWSLTDFIRILTEGLLPKGKQPYRETYDRELFEKMAQRIAAEAGDAAAKGE